jgi:hypothetical protein
LRSGPPGPRDRVVVSDFRSPVTLHKIGPLETTARQVAIAARLTADDASGYQIDLGGGDLLATCPECAAAIASSGGD